MHNDRIQLLSLYNEGQLEGGGMKMSVIFVMGARSLFTHVAHSLHAKEGTSWVML